MFEFGFCNASSTCHIITPQSIGIVSSEGAGHKHGNFCQREIQHRRSHRSSSWRFRFPWTQSLTQLTTNVICAGSLSNKSIHKMWGIYPHSDAMVPRGPYNWISSFLYHSFASLPVPTTSVLQPLTRFRQRPFKQHSALPDEKRLLTTSSRLLRKRRYSRIAADRWWWPGWRVKQKTFALWNFILNVIAPLKSHE